MSLSDDIDYLNQSKQNWNSNEGWLDKLLSVVGQLRNASQGTTDPNSLGLKIQLSYKESAELDLVALQSGGIVTVAGFRLHWQSPVAVIAKVTETIDDDASNDGFVLGLAGQGIFNEASGGVAGTVYSQPDYANALVASAFNLVADGDLEISTNNTAFTAGKMIVGFWYFKVD